MPGRFLHPSTIDLVVQMVLCGGGIPARIGCPAASPASTHWCGKQNISRCCRMDVPRGPKLPWVENHFHR